MVFDKKNLNSPDEMSDAEYLPMYRLACKFSGEINLVIRWYAFQPPN